MYATVQEMKTTFCRAGEVNKRWVVVDAADEVLGRVASSIAMMLRGKNHPRFTPHADTGDCVIVVNAARIKLTGDKLNQKHLKRYTGYPGGLKLVPYSVVMAKSPEKALRRAVWGMMPHGRLSRKQMRSLKIYRDGNHPHAAQKPEQAKS